MTSDEFGDIEQLDENLRKWFKEKWVRFGPDGKIRGACARGDDSEGKPKCLPQSKAHSIGKKGRKYAASKKRREDPNPERTGKAKNVATKKKTNEGVPFNECPSCRGPIVHESMLNEKQDACYHKVKSRYKVWPSAYASGALVQCRKKGASNWGTGGKKSESSIMKGIVDEASGTPGGLERYRTPAMVNATMQQSLYKRELAPIKAAEKKRKEAEYRKNNPSVSVPSIQIGASTYPIHVIHNWIGSKDLNAAVEFAVNKFAYRQSKDFKTEIAGDPDFQKAVKNFFNVAEKSLNHRDSTRTKSHWDGKVRAAPRETDTSSDGFDAINKINDALLPYYKKYGVDKTGRRVPPNFNYALGEAKAKQYVKPYNDPQTGEQIGWVSSDGYHKKYWQKFAKDSAIKHAKLNPDEVDEGIKDNIKKAALGLGTAAALATSPVAAKAPTTQQPATQQAAQPTIYKEKLHSLGKAVKKYGLTDLYNDIFSPGQDEETLLKNIKKIHDGRPAELGEKIGSLELIPSDRNDADYIARVNYQNGRLDIYLQKGGMLKSVLVPSLNNVPTGKKKKYIMLWANWTVGTPQEKKPMDFEENYTGEFAAEKTPAINPYGGLKDRQHRGAISETPTDNPTGASGEGGWRKYKPKPAGTFNEDLSQADVDSVARFADKLYKKLGIDITFTKHFMDRVNDERNGKPISGAELVRLFKKEYERWGKDVAQMGPDMEGTFKDLTTDINLPFVLRWDRDEEELDLVAKTVMRKKNFKTDNQEFPVDEDTSYAGGMGQGGNAGESYRKFKPKSAGTFKEDELDEACWKGYHKEGNKKMFGKTYPNCVKNTNEEEQLDEKCWDTHKQVGMKTKGGKSVPNCVPKESAIMKGIKNRLI